jgi:hypothetical protein
MKILIRLGALAACFLAVTANAQQPTWNKAQSEVWAAIERSWVDDVAENGKWPADYLLDNYVAWSDDMAAPRYKDAMIAWTRFGYAGNDTLTYELSPAAIVVEKDTAVVHYYVTSVTKDSSGKQTRSVSRITEVLVRNGKDWKWLAGVDYEPNLNDE